MTAIVLVAINARFRHASFGARYLLANLGESREQARLLEFDLERRPLEMAEAILQHDPAIVGVGVYIWNREQARQTVALLKTLRPELTVILGGPEVGHAPDEDPSSGLADHLIRGEAEVAFAELCRRILAGEPAGERLLTPLPPDPALLALPYDFYSDGDLAERVLYVESSRGCPFRCAFCLSALDREVRRFPLARFLAEMEKLLARGARQFKFVDRTFNLSLSHASAILEFFLARWRPGMFLHFEMIPDRLSDGLKTLLARFPPGGVQLEVGLQSLNPEVLHRLGRPQDNELALANLAWLARETGVHLHTDLIVGLPGEDLEGFGAGFDRLAATGPQEIQVGILKRLKGTPLLALEEAFALRFNPFPPFELLASGSLDFSTVRRLSRFARGIDLVLNSGRFPGVVGQLLREPSPFRAFLALCDGLFAMAGGTSGIAERRLFQLVRWSLERGVGWDGERARALVGADYQRGHPGEPTAFLEELHARRQPQAKTRQKRHLCDDKNE